MPPHGPGMIGALHSHNPEYPDDSWNLYSHLDPEATTALNATKPQDAISIFKPHVLRMTREPLLQSDADEELLVLASFLSPVHIRRIIVMGSSTEGEGETSQHPNMLRCFVNRPELDFTSIGETSPTQEFSLPVNRDGSVELTTSLHAFTGVNNLALFFPSNYGSETTCLGYIGLQGEHTHYRREAVDTVYEVLCNGQDIAQPEDQAGAHPTQAHGHERHMH